MDSPAPSITSDVSDLTEEELDLYFASYVPLSNLPTPPAKDMAVVEMPPPSPLEVHRTPELEAYAVHLSKLVPSNTSPQRPSIPTICGFLERAKLPLEVLAFTACILDALSQRFASSWRVACVPPTSNLVPFQLIPLPNSRHPAAATPEVIVLSALALAHGFVDDRGRSNTHWANIEGVSQFTAKEIDVTKRCILKDMDYGLFRITEEMVHRMVRDMQRANHCTGATLAGAMKPRKDSVTTAVDKEDRRPRLSLDMLGTALWQNGIQTPEPSP